MADDDMGTPTFRWAAVGTGTISRSVVPDIQAVSGASVTIVQSRDAEKARRFAEEFGIARSTDSYDEVLGDPDVDAVYLATPFAVHYDMAARALRAGKHVLVEKPMALDAAEVASLFEIAQAEGRFLMEAMWMKFNPAFQALHEKLRSGVVGDVRSVRASFGIPFPDETGSRTDLARSGGSLLDQGIYSVTLAHTVFGEPRHIVAAGTVREDGLDFSSHFTLEFGEGRYAQGASSMVEFSELTASVAGTEGWITLQAPFWATTSFVVHAGGMRKIFGEPDVVSYEQEGSGYVPMVRAVMDALGEGLTEHPVHTAADTIAVFRTMESILSSIRRSPEGRSSRSE